MQYTSEKPVDPITLLVYPDKDEFTMYEDDGKPIGTLMGVRTDQVRLLAKRGKNRGYAGKN